VIVISDTNVLSSLAAGDSLPALFQLYEKSGLAIPSAVRLELQAGVDQGRSYLVPVIDAIANLKIDILPLSAEEEIRSFSYPVNLGKGEREAIALSQTRKATLLCNDRNAMRYCKQHGIRVVSLVNILRLFWIEQVMPQEEVRNLIEKMRHMEGLTLTQNQIAEIFASQ
jgi:predicted nucleic acid-binding protein